MLVFDRAFNVHGYYPLPKLTEARIRAARTPDKDQLLSGGAGLYPRIRAGGSKKWALRKKYKANSTVTTLGHLQTWG